jgi:hypothetical protein
VRKEFDRGSPSLMEGCDELDEQCTRTCGILRVWLTDRVLSSLNGIMVWRGTFWRKGMDGDGLRHRDRDLASMELQKFSEGSWVQEEERGHEDSWE